MADKIVKKPTRTVKNPPEHIKTPEAKKANKYIPIEQMIELHEKGLSNPQIAAILHCSTGNVQARLSKCLEIITHTENYKKNRANILTYHQQAISSVLSASEVKPLKTARELKDAATAYGILYDKERLERGQSTANVDIHQTSAKLDAIRARRAEIAQKRLELGISPTGNGNDNE